MKTYLWFVGVLFLVGGTALAQTAPTSLADVARQNREKQSKEKQKPAMVLDEDDFPMSVGTKETGEASQAATGTTPSAKAKSPGDSGPAGASAPKDKAAGVNGDQVAELKKKLDSYTAERDSWKHVSKDYEDRLANETDDFRRQMYEDALQNDRNNVALYQKKVDQTQGELNQAQQAAAKQASPNQGETGSGNSK